MNTPPLQPQPVTPRSHWTDPVSREETLAIRGKFRKAGWRPPNHKPATTKNIAYAKSLWNRYDEDHDVSSHSRRKDTLRAEDLGIPLQWYWKYGTATFANERQRVRAVA
jgi:hypothetical protein